MAKRVCIQSGCGKLIAKGQSRCPKHERDRDRARGTRVERGYDNDHTLARAEWAPLVATGTVDCRRCGHRIPATAPWDLGHPDADCPKPRAPEHRRCNRGTAGRPT